MRVVILTFSSSGATHDLGSHLCRAFRSRGIAAEHLELAREQRIVCDGDYVGYLQDCIPPHDLLCIGSPVYEHHLQEHMARLIKALPCPGQGWARYACAFVTYGCISSGVALEEAGRWLQQGGRVVLCGMKVAARHTLLENLLGRRIGAPAQAGELERLVYTATEQLEKLLVARESITCSVSLCYQPLKKRLLDMTLLNPKFKPFKLLPSIVIDLAKCIGCGLCSQRCPVFYLTPGSAGKPRRNSSQKCLHCFNCMESCPVGAITPDKARKQVEFFFALLTRGGYEQPTSSLITYEGGERRNQE